MNPIALFLLATILCATLLGSLYRYFVRPVVLFHFEEEHRRDFDARKRRRAFEARVRTALAFVYFSSVARVAGESFHQLPKGIFWGIAGLLFLIAGAFAYAAIQRWRDSFTE